MPRVPSGREKLTPPLARVTRRPRWCRMQDSNPRPLVYKTTALPAELIRRTAPRRLCGDHGWAGKRLGAVVAWRLAQGSAPKMDFQEYRRHDAVGLAELVAKRDVTAGELLDLAVARMGEVNPKINAVTRDLTDLARSQSPAAKGPLAGVPYLLKDLGAALGGVPTSYGSAMFAEVTPAADSAITALYKAAGLSIFGKTNTP